MTQDAIEVLRELREEIALREGADILDHSASVAVSLVADAIDAVIARHAARKEQRDAVESPASSGNRAGNVAEPERRAVPSGPLVITYAGPLAEMAPDMLGDLSQIAASIVGDGPFTLQPGMVPTLVAKELDRLRGMVEALSEANAELDRLRAEAEKLRGEVAECRRWRHGYEAQANVAAGFLHTAEHDLAAMTRSRDETAAEAKLRIEQRDEARRELETSKQELSAARAALAEAEGALREIHAALGRGDHGPKENARCALEAIADLRQRVTDAEKERGETEAERDEASAQAARASAVVEAARTVATRLYACSCGVASFSCCGTTAGTPGALLAALRAYDDGGKEAGGG